MQSDQLKQELEEQLFLPQNTPKLALNMDETDSKLVIKQDDNLVNELLKPKLDFQAIENIDLESRKVNPEDEIKYKAEFEEIRLERQTDRPNTPKLALEDLNMDDSDPKLVIKQADDIINEILNPNFSFQEIEEKINLKSQKVNPDHEIKFKAEFEKIRLKQQKIKDLEQTLKERFKLIRKMISENTLEKNFKLASKSSQELAGTMNSELISETVTQHFPSHDCSKTSSEGHTSIPELTQ